MGHVKIIWLSLTQCRGSRQSLTQVQGCKLLQYRLHATRLPRPENFDIQKHIGQNISEESSDIKCLNFNFLTFSFRLFTKQAPDEQ